MLKIRRTLVKFHCILLAVISFLFFTLIPIGYQYFLCSFLKKLSYEEPSFTSFRLWEKGRVIKEQFLAGEKMRIPETPSLPLEDFFTIYALEGKNRVASFTRSYEKGGSLFHIELLYSLREWDSVMNWLIWFLFPILMGLIFLYGGFTWLIIRKITRPIEKMLLATRPYREGKIEFLSQIFLSPSEERDFEPLAETFNSLSEKIQRQVQALFIQHQENQSILESLNEGIISFNKEGIITYANQITLQLFEQSRELFLFQRLEETENKGNTALLEECKKLYFSCQEEKKASSKLITLKKGSKIYINLLAIPKKEGVILVLQDRTSDFRVLQMGKDFIANASHELRTPITVIRGFAETLQEHPELSEEMRQGIIKKIVTTSERLNVILKSLLTLNDVENASSSHFVECDLKILIKNCKALLTSLYKKVEFHLNLSKDISIKGDAALLELALMNLLENGIKYSKKPAHIFLQAKKEQGKLSLSIKDQGIGIPKEDIAYIFERFYTVDKARSRKLGGLGLGLSIVKNVVEKHGGTIYVDSEENKGTLFHLQFPCDF